MGSEVTPRFFQHLQTVYALLVKEAKLEDIAGVEQPVFRGSISALYREAKISQSLYTRIFDTLNEAGCITTLQRGAREIPSIIVLHSEPSESQFTGRGGRRLTADPEAATLAGKVRALEKNVGGLNIVEMFRDIENRLSRLEGGKSNGKSKTAS